MRTHLFSCPMYCLLKADDALERGLRSYHLFVLLFDGDSLLEFTKALDSINDE